MLTTLMQSAIMAMQALQSGIETFGVNDEWAEKFAESLTPVVEPLNNCVSAVTKAVGSFPVK